MNTIVDLVVRDLLKEVEQEYKATRNSWFSIIKITFLFLFINNYYFYSKLKTPFCVSLFYNKLVL